MFCVLQPHFQNLQNGLAKCFAVCITHSFIIRFTALAVGKDSFFCKFTCMCDAKAAVIMKVCLQSSAILQLEKLHFCLWRKPAA